MSEKFAFLTSVRFWKLFVMGVMTGGAILWPDSPVLKAVAVAVDVWLGGSVAVKTIDKANE